MTIEKASLLENSELDIETQQQYADAFLEMYNAAEPGLFTKIFPNKVRDFLTSDDVMGNAKDALGGHLMSVVDPVAAAKLTIARNMIVSGTRPTLEEVNARYQEQNTGSTETHTASASPDTERSNESPPAANTPEIMSSSTKFSPQDINYLTRYFPYKEGNCSGNVREGLDNLHEAGLTDMFIPALNRAQMHGTLARKQLLGIQDSDMMEGETITIGGRPAPNASLRGMHQAIDFSKESGSTADVSSQVSKISNMQGNAMVLVFAKRKTIKGPVGRRKGYPGHASIAFRGDDGKIYVHDQSFSGGAIEDFGGKTENIFELGFYLEKLQNSSSDGNYRLDAVISGDISKPEDTSVRPLKAQLKG